MNKDKTAIAPNVLKATVINPHNYDEPRFIARGDDLVEVNLAYARLRKGDLVKAHFDGGTLVGANLNGVNLERASLAGAKVYDTHMS